jgi:hypothetical protein
MQVMTLQVMTLFTHQSECDYHHPWHNSPGGALCHFVTIGANGWVARVSRQQSGRQLLPHEWHRAGHGAAMVGRKAVATMVFHTSGKIRKMAVPSRANHSCQLPADARRMSCCSLLRYLPIAVIVAASSRYRGEGDHL